MVFTAMGRTHRLCTASPGTGYGARQPTRAHWLTVIRAQVLSGLTERQLNFPRIVPDVPVTAQLTASFG